MAEHDCYWQCTIPVLSLAPKLAFFITRTHPVLKKEAFMPIIGELCCKLDSHTI